MRKLNICSIARKKNPNRQFQNRYRAIQTCPNLMSQNFKTKQPNEKWGTDITYINTQQGFVYLAVIKDFFDGTILGHALSRNNSTSMVLQAVRSEPINFEWSPKLCMPADISPLNFLPHEECEYLNSAMQPSF